MASPIVDQFMEALFQLEERKEADPLLRLFCEDCEIRNVSIPGLHGREGVERFWKDYSSLFKQVRTKFTRVTEAGDRVFLEWVSEGEFPSGKPLHYEGLTVLEIENGQVKRLKAYHDSAAFLRESGKASSHGGLTSAGQVMEEGPDRDRSTPGEGVLTSTLTDRDAATG